MRCVLTEICENYFLLLTRLTVTNPISRHHKNFVNQNWHSIFLVLCSANIYWRGSQAQIPRIPKFVWSMFTPPNHTNNASEGEKKKKRVKRQRPISQVDFPKGMLFECCLVYFFHRFFPPSPMQYISSFWKNGNKMSNFFIFMENYAEQGWEKKPRTREIECPTNFRGRKIWS